jgi:hypothetical protein
MGENQREEHHRDDGVGDDDIPSGSFPSLRDERENPYRYNRCRSLGYEPRSDEYRLFVVVCEVSLDQWKLGRLGLATFPH